MDLSKIRETKSTISKPALPIFLTKLPLCKLNILVSATLSPGNIIFAMMQQKE